MVQCYRNIQLSVTWIQSSHYNGFDNPGYLEAVTPSVQKAIAHIHDFTGITFITVATLNAAKGVEQIP